MPRSPYHRLSLAVISAIAVTVFLVLWIGHSSSAVPFEATHSASLSQANDAHAITISKRAIDSTTRREEASFVQADTPHGHLILVDAATARAIPNANVAVTYSKTERETWTTSDLGAAPLLPRVGARLTIQADGYVPLTAQLEESTAAAAKNELRIGLSPGGVFELQIDGDRSKQTSNATVVLLPQCPRVGEWSDDWRRVVPLFETILTSEQLGLERRSDGIWIASAREPRPTSHEVTGATLRINGVPPGTHYRWALLRGGPAVMDPPYERSALAENALGQAQIQSSEPEHLSGPFAIRAGETTTFALQLLPTASIRGVFPVSGCDVPPQVKLYQLTTLHPANGPAVCRFRELAFVVSSEQGGFQFDGVGPGTYAVRAWWRRAEVVQFCSATCEVVSTDVDLGELDIISGERVFMRLDLRERSSDRLLAPGEALAGAATQLGAVMIQAVPDSKLAHEQVFEALPIAFETTYELRGFRPGTLSIAPQVPPWLLARGVTSRIEVGPSVRGKLKPESLQTLHLLVEPRHEWLLELPDEFLGKPFEVMSRRTVDGEVRRLEVRGPSGIDDLPYLRVLAPRCDQELLFRELAEPHRVAMVHVHEPPTSPSLQPAFESPLPRRVDCPEGAVGQVVGWTLRDWQTAAPIWSAAIESDGCAILRGVPANQDLIGLSGAPDVAAR